MKPGRVVAVVGPTAAGKSALGIRLAHDLGGEVISADSMQLYRGMDIGTAKLRPEEQEGVPHHLLDIWDVTQAASVADYQRRAREVVDELLARRVTPILVGGSGLYVRAVVDHLEFPGTDPELRASLELVVSTGGSAVLHQQLAERDPDAAARILPSNGRRIVRALEVIELTGRPFSATMPSYDRTHYDAVQIGIDVDDLAARIDRRVDVMWEQGFVDEVRALEAAGLRDGVTASRALGYAQVLQLLAGELTENEARAQTVQNTKHFARRQRRWFRRDPRVRWLEPGEDPRRTLDV